MPKVSDLDEYLHASSVQNGEIVTIVDRPVFVNAEESPFGNPFFQLHVELSDGTVKTYTPNKTTLRKLAQTFGNETDGWVNKKIRLSTVRQNVKGETRDVLYGEPA